MITVHNLPDTLRAGLTEAEKQILEMGKDQTSISFWPSPAAYAHLVLEKHVKALEEAGFSPESLGSHAAPEKPELTQKSEGLALVWETTEDEAEGSTVGGEVAGATGKAGDWMEVIKEGGTWDSARTIRAAFLGYLLGEGFFPKGFIIVGARLVGPWQWKGAFPAHGLALIGCYLEGPIQLTEVEAPDFRLFLGSCYIVNPEKDNEKTNSPLLLLQQTQLRNVYFEDCRIGGPIHLKGFRAVQGKVSLVKTLIHSSEVALQIENTVCERELLLSEAHFGGAVHLKDVKVEGEVSIKSSRIESSSGVALRVENVEVEKRLAFREARLDGEVHLSKLKGQEVLFYGSHIESSSDVALHVKDTEFGKSLVLDQAHLRGRMRLVKVKGGEMSLSKSHIESSSDVALHMEDVEFMRGLGLEKVRLRGKVQLVKFKGLDVRLSKARIESSSNVALHVEDVEVGGGGVTLEGAQLVGRVRLAGGKVEGGLYLQRARIESSLGVALYVGYVEVSAVTLEGSQLVGGVRLEGGKVEGGLYLQKARIESSSGVALHVEEVEVGDDVTLEGSQLVGGVRLEGGKVEGRLYLEGSHIQSSSDIALHIERIGGGAWLSLKESHLKGRVVLKSAEVGDINIQGSVIATPGPLAVHLSGVRAKGLSMEEALFRWIAGGSKAESPALSDGDSLILVSIEKSRIVEGNIRVKNIKRAPVEVVLGEGAAQGSGDGGGAEKGAVRATFQVKETKLRPQSVVNPLIVEVVGKWDVEMGNIEVVGDFRIAVRSAESVITMRGIRTQQDILLGEAEEGALPVRRVELEDVRVGGLLWMQGLRVEEELSLKKGWVGGGVYLEEVEVGRVEAPGRLHLEGLRTVELDLSGAEVRGALSLQGVRVHTYSDRPWTGLTDIEVKDFEWMVMPLEREKGLVPRHLSWRRKMPPAERLPFLRRLYRTYRLRYHQPPLRPDSMGYTAAERWRLWWGRWVIRLFIWLLSGKESIGELFRRFKRGHRPRSGLAHKEMGSAHKRMRTAHKKMRLGHKKEESGHKKEGIVLFIAIL